MIRFIEKFASKEVVSVERHGETDRPKRRETESVKSPEKTDTGDKVRYNSSNIFEAVFRKYGLIKDDAPEVSEANEIPSKKTDGKALHARIEHDKILDTDNKEKRAEKEVDSPNIFEAVFRKYGLIRSDASDVSKANEIPEKKQDGKYLHIRIEYDEVPDTDNKERNAEQEVLNKTRELTDEEKDFVKKALGWGDKQIAKCTIEENSLNEGKIVIHYRTDRCDLEGKRAENGVLYVRKRIEYNGIIIEGVFPKFDSVFSTYLSPENQKSNAYAKECNAKLKEAIKNDPELRSRFTDEQLKDIENNRTPTGYVWHHNEEPGKMELVKREDHDRTIGGAAHTGGNALWGPDSVDNARKGESF